MAYEYGIDKICTILLLLYSTIHTTTAMIRYYSDQDLMTRNAVIFEHVDTGVTSQQWSVDNTGCQFTSTSAPLTQMSCTTPGLHTITLDYVKSGVNSQLTKILSIGKRYYCYQWYMAETSFDLDTDLVNSTDPLLQQVCIWVVDPRYSSGEEKNHSASSPSLHSSYLTNQFKNLGQRPKLQEYVHGVYAEHIQHTYLAYLQDYSCWLFDVKRMSGKELLVSIRGEPIPLFSCLIGDTIVPITESSTPAVIGTNNTLTTLTVSVAPEVILHPCYEDVAIFVSSDELFWTKDGFYQSSPVKLSLYDTEGIHVSGVTVTDIILTIDKLVILDTTRIFAVDLADSNSQVLDNSTVASSLESRDWCCSDYSGQHYNDMFVAWSEDTIHLYTRSENLTLLSLPTSGYTEFKVLAVRFSPVYDVIGVAAKVTSGSIQVAVFLYGISSFSWQLVTTLPYNTGQPYGMQFMWSGTNKLILWSQSTLHFVSYNLLTSVQSTETVSISPSIVDHVVQNVHGYIVIVSTNKEVYYTTSQWDDVIQLPLKLSEDLTSVPWFDPTRHLKVLSRNGQSIDRSNYPLKNEIINAVHPDIHCSFFPLERNHCQDHYFMDINTNIRIWVAMAYSKEHFSPNTTFFQFVMDGEENLCSVTLETQVSHYTDYVLENMTVTIENIANIDVDKLRNSTGEIGFTISPRTVLPICHHPAKTTSFVTVGCLPSLHLQVDGVTPSGCDNYINHTFTVLKPDGVSLEIAYDMDRLGCPLDADKLQVFRPTLHICSDTGCNGIMEANFVMWEENDQPFTYSHKMSDVKCLSVAQTWASMLAATSDQNRSNAWGPQNYQECFVKDEVNFYSQDLSPPYQIFNSSSPVGIKFDTTASGIYVMHAMVVDPLYSFCKLEVVFAVNVVGQDQPDNSFILLTSIACIIIFILLSSSFSYIHFRNVYYNVGSETTDEWMENREQLLANLGCDTVASARSNIG